MEFADYTKMGYQSLNGLRQARVSPNQGALIALMQRTGYSMVQQNGQRRYGGPPPGWEGSPPPRGAEVFVGKIPRDCFEDELVPVFEKTGRIYELRLMMDFSGTNRGYCFVTYTSRSEAKRAVKELDKYEIRKGRFLGVNFSVDNCRLYLGAIPRDKTQQDIIEEMRRVTEGVVDVLVYPSSMDKSKNRGFAFVEYESHRAAALARKKIIPGKLELWGQHVIVDWAEPEQMVDEDIMEKVKNLYIRNLMPNTTEETLKYVFERAAGRTGCVERVKRIKDFAFVHFVEREDALRALTVMNGSRLEGAILEVALAKPVLKNCCSRFSRLQDKEFMKGCEHDCSTFHGAADCYCGRSGSFPYAHAGGYGRRENHLYDLHPDMVLTPGDPTSLSHMTTKSAVQLLEEVCYRNQWGSPQYQLHTTVKHMSAATLRLYMYKVVIPALTSEQTELLFQVPRLCDDPQSAKEYAASHVLKKLRLLVTDLSAHIVNQNQMLLSQTLSSSPDSQYTTSDGSSPGFSLDGNRSSPGATAAATPSCTTNMVYTAPIPVVTANAADLGHKVMHMPSQGYSDPMSYISNSLQHLSLSAPYPSFGTQQF